MLKSGGSIIMVSSVSAHFGQAKQGCYNAAKAAQELLMKCMALDLVSQSRLGSHAEQSEA